MGAGQDHAPREWLAADSERFVGLIELEERRHAMVAQLVAIGFPRAACEAAARATDSISVALSSLLS